MKVEKLVWDFSPQHMACQVCDHHQATWKVTIKEPLQFTALVCSVCVKLSENEIAKKLYRGLK